MTEDARDARRALDEIENVKGKSRALQGYSYAWPVFVVWGLVWLAANLATYYSLLGRWAWPVGILVGTAATLIFVLRMSRQIGRMIESPSFGRRFSLRFAAQVAIFFAGISAIFTVLDPPTADQTNAAISLFVAISYLFLGLYHGARIFVAGVAVAVVTLVGFHGFREVFDLWMAFIGGGILIATGLWLRTA